MRDDDPNGAEVDLLISGIQHNQSNMRGALGENDQDLEQLLKTGAFTKEMMLGSTIRNLGNTIKQVRGGNFENNSMHSISQLQEEEEYEEGAFDDSQQQFDENDQQQQQQLMSGFENDLDNEDDEEQLSQLQQEMAEGTGAAEGEEEDVIDIDNPDELAKKGLKRI